MNKKKRFLSLRSKLLLIMALALVVAGFVFFTFNEFGNFLVWRYYLNEENVQERAEGYIRDFQQYVKENKLSIEDTEEIAKWSGGRYVDILLYKDKDLIYAPEWFEDFEATDTDAEPDPEEEITGDGEYNTEENTGEAQGTESTEDSELTESEVLNNGWFSGDRSFEQYLTQEARARYQSVLDSLLNENSELSPVYFVDGTLLIRVVDYSEDYMKNLVFAASLILAVLILAIIMTVNLTSLTNRVKKLASDINLVENGNLDLPITLEGRDELTGLAEDVNSMRNSVVDNMKLERQAWEANAGLITAMSHDIRTPLTVLMGYLDLLELQNDNPDSAEYISACKENAERLKHLSDDLFSYFLVFGKNGANLELSQLYESDCIHHMIAEHCVLLSENGYAVEYPEQISAGMLRIDTTYLGRVVDNLFSNIRKYADPKYPVRITAECTDRKLVICFENRINPDQEQVESNGIGLKTCVRIMEQMGGSLTVSFEDDTTFVATLILPVEEE